MKQQKNKNVPNKVVIIVWGGVVQNIYSSNSQIHVELLDYDNLDIQDYQKDKKELESRTKNMVMAQY